MSTITIGEANRISLATRGALCVGNEIDFIKQIFALGVAKENDRCSDILKKLADETLALQHDSNALDEIILRHRANALKNGEEAIRARK